MKRFALQRRNPVVPAPIPRPDWFTKARINDLFAPLPERPWLVKDLDLCPGPCALLVGYGFSGKTLCAQALGVAVALGHDVWGRFSCRRGNVLHIDFEMGRDLMMERYQRLTRGAGADVGDVRGRIEALSRPRLRFEREDSEADLRSAMRGFDLVIIDSLRAAYPTIDENSSAARAPLDMLARISEEENAVIIVIHHTRKPSVQQRGGAHALRGTSAFYDAAGSVLILERAKSGTIDVHHEKARTSGVLWPSFGLNIEDGSEEPDSARSLRVIAREATAPGEPLEAAILAVVAATPGMSGTAVVTAVRANRGAVHQALSRMTSHGSLRNGGSKKHPSYVVVDPIKPAPNVPPSIGAGTGSRTAPKKLIRPIRNLQGQPL